VRELAPHWPALAPRHCWQSPRRFASRREPCSIEPVQLYVRARTSAAASERAIRAANEGDRASPAGSRCVASARRAAPDATNAGVVAPGSDVLRFSERRLPAMPDSAPVYRQLGRLGGGIVGGCCCAWCRRAIGGHRRVGRWIQSRRRGAGRCSNWLRLGLYRRRRLDTVPAPGLNGALGAVAVSGTGSSARLAAARQLPRMATFSIDTDRRRRAWDLLTPPFQFVVRAAKGRRSPRGRGVGGAKRSPAGDDSLIRRASCSSCYWWRRKLCSRAGRRCWFVGCRSRGATVAAFRLLR